MVVADLDPGDVDEVQRRVVRPVVGSLIRPDELEDILIEVGSEEIPGAGLLTTLSVSVKAGGEWIAPPIGWGVDDGRLMDAEALAGDLHDRLRDELTESRISWGKLREGAYEVLPPGSPDGA